MRSQSTLRKDIAWALAALLFLSVLPLLTQSRVTLDFVIRLAALGIFASSLNILVGYGGMVSFGHAMFFGSGAYVFGLLMQKTDASIPVAMLGSIAFSGLLGLLIGAICVRLKEIYFSFLTLAFQMLIHSVILTWTSLTGGDQGLMGGIPRPPFLGINLSDHTSLYWFACAFRCAVFVVDANCFAVAFCATLRMVRDSSERAAFLGIDVWRIKLYAFYFVQLHGQYRGRIDGALRLGRISRLWLLDHVRGCYFHDHDGWIACVHRSCRWCCFAAAIQ
jgi:branched-chain amino acid transport system permease protein